MSEGMMTLVCLPNAKYSHPPEEGPSLPIEGWLKTLYPKGRKTKFSQETRIDSQSMRMCSSNKRGGELDNPQGITQFAGLDRPQKLPPQNAGL